jgi:hypothetical protein
MQYSLLLKKHWRIERTEYIYRDSNINTEFNLFLKLIKNTDNIMTIHNSIDKEHALL